MTPHDATTAVPLVRRAGRRMNIRKRSKLAVPCTVMRGDTISVRWRDGDKETVFVEDTFTGTQTFDEAFIFDDIIEGRNAIGGGLLEQEPKP